MVLALRLSIFLQAICTVLVCLSLVCTMGSSPHYSRASGSKTPDHESKLDFLRSLQRSLELTRTVGSLQFYFDVENHGSYFFLTDNFP